MNDLKELKKEFEKKFVVQSWDGPTLIQGDVYQSGKLWNFIESSIKKAREEERERTKNLLKEHLAQLRKTGWITTDKDFIDAINQYLEQLKQNNQ